MINNSKLLKWADEFLNKVTSAGTCVALTGAGVSTASGIPDFRSPGGLYEKLPRDIFELHTFLQNPTRYYKLAIDKIHKLDNIEPNITHRMLALLENRNRLEAIVTQNIDGLHQKAGTRKVIEFHGNVTGFHCIKCTRQFDLQTIESKIDQTHAPHCQCGGLIRPDVIFFGDPIPLDALETSRRLAQTTEIFITMGSSLMVQPAASLALLAKESGAKLIIIGRGQTQADQLCDYKYETELEQFSLAIMQLLD